MHLGVDLGTSSVKLLLADSKGNILDIASADYPLFFPEKDQSERMAFDVLFVVGIAIITPIAGVPWSMREATAISFLIHGPMLDILQKPTRKLFSKAGIQPPPTLMNDPAEFVRTEHKTAS